MGILKFGATWCKPCQQLTRVLKDGGIKVTALDIDEVPEQVRDYEIRSIPVLVHESSGEKLVGLKTLTEIKEWINKCEALPK